MEKLIYLWNIGSVNQISIKQEIRCFTNKSISWKPSFIIVRALNTNKPKIPQIYDKIMKLSLSTIWFILHFCRKCWEKHPWKSLTLALFWAYFFFSLKLNNLYIYISMERKFYVDSTLQKNNAMKIAIFSDMKGWAIAMLFFLTCCVLVKTKTGMHFHKETLNILNFS